ncbi:MAG: GGDEF domain-containing protein [Halomonadaceae bacterium]|nr:MAG: GGDEF domain-containing protein [Halomonadaceae bacterium]
MAKILTFCAVLALTLSQVTTVFADTLALTPDQGSLQLGPYVEYLEDPEGTLTIDQVQHRSSGWVASQQDILSFGYTASAYWVRFRLTQDGARALSYLLEIAYPVLDHVHVHVFEEAVQVAEFTMGDQLPYGKRPIDNPNFLVPLTVQPSATTTLYVRVQSSSAVQVPLTLYQDLSLVEAHYNRGVVQALFYGAMLAMAIYNLLVFFSIRAASYLYYVMVVVSVSVLLGGIEGLTFKYLWPNSTWLNDSTLIVGLSGIVTFSALFFRDFLAIPQTRPVLGKVLLTFAILTAFTAAGAFLLPYRPMMLMTILLAVGAIMTGFWAGIVRWRDGFYAARYLNIAWSCVLVAGLLFALNKLGIVPRNWFTEHVMQIGTGLQALLLSFALAHRITYERDMREQAQQASAAAQEELLEQQIRTNEDLDRMVRQRTEELEQANGKLKEIGATDGLTNLLNRRAFEERFQTEYARAYRDKHPLAILMIDLDHFKSINDNYGHPFGDLCLVKAAGVFKANIRRPPDLSARYGGEEFILMLPNTDVDGAVCVAQAILDSLAQTEIKDENHCVTISASIGVAVCIPGDQSDRETLLKEADQSLYVAKKNGRNRVEWQPREPVA